MTDGVTLQQNLQRVEENMRKTDPTYVDPRLVLTDIPPRMLFVWKMFLKLCQSRTFSEYGPSGISCGEIEARCRLTGIRLEHWEVEALTILDKAYLDAATPVASGKTKTTELPQDEVRANMKRVD